MKDRPPLDVVKDLVGQGLDRKLSRTVRRELKLARAHGIMQGLLPGLRAGDVCIDCGAHYGEVSKRLAHTGATVHSFEPDPHSWGRLNSACGDLANVQLHNAAVSTEAGKLTLYRSNEFGDDIDRASTGSSVLKDNAVADADNAVEVEAIDFVSFLEDQIAQSGRVAFLKMDIEGAEIDLLGALVKTDLLTKVGLTVVETHRWLFPNASERYDALHQVANSRPDMNLYLGWI